MEHLKLNLGQRLNQSPSRYVAYVSNIILETRVLNIFMNLRNPFCAFQLAELSPLAKSELDTTSGSGATVPVVIVLLLSLLVIILLAVYYR